MMTLKKISHISGYSTSTVSKALNNCLDVSLDTKKIIKDIALQYNYTPNKNAVALRKNKTNIIAVILPRINQKLYSDSLYNIQKKASKYGYRILIYQSFEKTAMEKQFLDEISDGSVDAAIFISESISINSKTQIPIAHLKMVKDQTKTDVLHRWNMSLDNFLKRIK